ALGGDEVKAPAGMQITLPPNETYQYTQGPASLFDLRFYVRFPAHCVIHYPATQSVAERPEPFVVSFPKAKDRFGATEIDGRQVITLLDGCVQLIPGSSWGTFTIAATIPIALLVGLYMYRIRPGRVVEASLIGAALTIGATIAGGFIRGTGLEHAFNLSDKKVILAMAAYGFIASVLPVWVLLCPRDYLSSFLKIGTIVLIVIGVFVANPSLPCPPLNHTFAHGGPTFKGDLFPFLFICILCASVSVFHSSVS